MKANKILVLVLSVLIALAMVPLTACAEAGEGSPGIGTEAGTGTEVGTGAENGSGTQTDPITQTEPEKKVTYDKMIIRWYNVGPGDCIYMHTPDGKNIMIDGGLPKKGKKVMKKLQKLNIKVFDYVISTHPDDDHVGGLYYIFQNYQVKNFYYPSDVPYNTDLSKKLMKAAKAEAGCELYCPVRGDIIKGGDGATIKFVHDNKDYKTPNEDSLAMFINYGELQALITGDTSKGTQNKIEKHNVDVTDLPHHGAKNAVSSKFIKRFDPEYVVVSADGHTWGHPSKKFFKALKKYDKKIKAYRTDKLGDITLTATKTSWKFDKKGKKVGKYA